MLGASVPSKAALPLVTALGTVDVLGEGCLGRLPVVLVDVVAALNRASRAQTATGGSRMSSHVRRPTASAFLTTAPVSARRSRR